MMKHECKPIAMADWADEVCSICRASLTLPPYDNLAEAIQRVRELHQDNVLLGLSTCIHCDEPYPCPTIKALDGEQ